MAIRLNTVWNSPQANDDVYWWTEDELQGLNYLSADNIITLDVMSNDLGGNGKSLYSIDDGDGNFLQDMLDNNVTTGWEYTESGNRIRIVNGKIEFDISHDINLIGGSINGLSAGESLCDTFTYSIQLGNGTLSWANVSVRIDGVNDAPAAVADTNAGNEDTIITGSVATNDSDPDHDAVLTYSLDAAVAGLTLNPDGSYSLDAGNAAYQYLAAGETLAVVADYTVTDEWGASSSSALTITITGSDEASCDTFAPAYVVGSGTAIALGDVNGDGKTDLISGVDGSGFSSVRFGNGDGTFGTAATYAVPGHFNQIAIADLNGDNSLDFVVTDGLGVNAVSVLLNNGNGTFASQVTYATGPEPTGVALGDLNADGKVDIVTANQGASTISILLGNGDGTFVALVPYTVAFGPVAVEIADVNGDNKADLIVGDNHSDLVSVLLGDGSGSFPTHAEYSAPGVFGMAVGDLNGDARPDIVGSNQHGGSNQIWVLLNNGDGSYAAPTIIAEPDSAGIILNDLNGDGKLDLAIGSFSTSFVDVMFGNGDGTFGARTSYAAPGAGFLEMSDLNGDSFSDIVVTTSGGTVSVLLHDTCLLV